MPIEIGEIAALFRYPVKSMRGEPLDAADLGWHGLDGDRRLAFRRVDDRGGFPWLTASRIPELILFSPEHQGVDVNGSLPTHVRTPAGEMLPTFSPELAAEISRRHGSPVEMTHLNRGIFDEASISVIASATVSEIGKLAGHPRTSVDSGRTSSLPRRDRSRSRKTNGWEGSCRSETPLTPRPSPSSIVTSAARW